MINIKVPMTKRTFMVWIWLTLFILPSSYLIYHGTYNIEAVAERPPMLYCQYGAGHGVAVFEFESIGNNQILTDADDVFDLLICEDWKEYVNGKESE